MFHLILVVSKDRNDPYSLKRCLTQLNKSTKLANDIGIICDSPIEGADSVEGNIHINSWSNFKKITETSALSNIFPYLRADDCVVVCESDLLVLKDNFLFSESLCKNVERYEDSIRYSDFSQIFSDAAALRSPIIVKSSSNDGAWTGFGANLIEMYGCKNIVEMLIKKIKYRRYTPTAVSAAGINLPLEKWLFEDDDFLIKGCRGKKVLWSDAFTNGLKSQMQYSFKKVTLTM